MADKSTEQTVSDDEPSEDDEVIDEEGKNSKKRKATGAAAHMCLKLGVEGKHVRLTMEQKAKISESVFAADHLHLSCEAVINLICRELQLQH